MKRYIFNVILFIIFFVVMAIPVASALSANEVEFDKMPISPGETTDIYVKITNFGPEVNDISVQLVHQDNTSAQLPSGGSAENIGILKGSEGIENLPTGKSKEVKFTIFSASTSEDGIYNLDIIAKMYKEDETSDDDQNVTFSNLIEETLTTISIQVVKKPSNVIIGKVSDTSMTQGSAKEIELKVKNVGKKTAKNVVLEINPARDEAEIIHPFSVVDTGSRFVLGDIMPDGSAELKFKLSTGTDAIGGDYNLPISITSEGTGTSIEHISIRVVPKAELAIIGITTDPAEIRPGELTNFMVSIKNFGKNSAKSVRMDIEENNYIDRIPTAFLGNIKSEGQSTAIFDLNVLPEAPESFPLKIKITYQDGVETYQVTEIYTIVTSGVYSGPTESRDLLSGDIIPLVILLASIPISILIIMAGFRKRRVNIINDGFEMYGPKVESVVEDGFSQNLGQNLGQNHTGISQDQDWFSQMMGDKKSKS